MNQLKQIEDVLPIEEFNKLKEIKDELTDAWQKNQIFRTDTEARYAVLNDFKFPTNASKYWQAVREQMVHFNELTSLSFDIRRKQLDLEKINNKIQNLVETALTHNFGHEYALIDRDELLFQIASMERIAKDRVREVMQWSKIKQELDDGSFDKDDVNTHQKETLFKSILNRAKAAPENISSDETLTIQGILHGLKDEKVNKKFLESLGIKTEKK